MKPLNFAQISDIHISSLGDHDDLLSGRAADFLTAIVNDLNRNADLDFVFVTGDLMDLATQDEFDQVLTILKTLAKPYYVIPGNHDRRKIDAEVGLTRHDFARHFNPQFEDRPPDLAAQAGYWSLAINDAIQLIGLDSIRDEDWGGIIDEAQLTWLRAELTANANKLIIVGVHHPLHPLSPLDHDPAWRNFVCDNGPDLLALFDQHPQVKLVLSGHHHQTKIDRLGARLHAACASIAIYPCAYRTFRLTSEADAWQLTWQTHPATNEDTIAEARAVMLQSWQAIGFDREIVEAGARLVLGTEVDRAGNVEL